ncbi:MAG TPA: hypothetical protein ENN05_11305 [Deltaproteobacteria bacterium]|nr:hypothetical protein [Deltaproteobacteria bacterium]
METLKSAGAEFGYDAGKTSLLHQRLREGRFHLAVPGQFKRGKSTLLNALLGETLLPTSVIPLRAIPTFIRSGSMKLKVTHASSGSQEEILCESRIELISALEQYVSEEKNPRNRLL